MTGSCSSERRSTSGAARSRIRDERLRSLQDYVHDLEQRTALDNERVEDARGSGSKSLRANSARSNAELAAHGRDRADTEAAVSLEQELREAARAAREPTAAPLGGRGRDPRAAARGAGGGAVRGTGARPGPGPHAAHDRIGRDGHRGWAASATIATEERAGIVTELAAWAKQYASVTRELSLIGPRLTWAIDDREREAEALRATRARSTPRRRRSYESCARSCTPPRCGSTPSRSSMCDRKRRTRA